MDTALILLAGLAMGWINNLAGAGGAIGLIAFAHCAGLDPVQANASLRLSAMAIGGMGLIGFLSGRQKIPAKMWLYGLLTVPGAVIGALGVVHTPAWIQQLGLAVLLTAVLAQQFWRGSAPPEERGARTPTPLWLMLLLFTWLGAHMGFIQVATGMVAIFVLGHVHSHDLVRVNAAKMVLVLCSAIASNITLATTGKIAWGPAALLAVGAGIGSFLASRWSLKKGHGAVRIIVIAICIVVLAHLGWQLLG